MKNTVRTVLAESHRSCVVNPTMFIRNKNLAWNAWNRLSRDCPEHDYSKHYMHGFVQGYRDYLDAGGCGEPPGLPPWYLRGIKYQTPAGYEAVQEWFAGWRHGSQQAMESGYRELIVVQNSGPGLDTDSYAYSGNGTPRLGQAKADAAPQSQPETLPPPRPTRPPAPEPIGPPLPVPKQ